jgi:hypothetical protein
VACEACGEGINYQREVHRHGRTLCRFCAGDAYYAREGALGPDRHVDAHPTGDLIAAVPSIPAG